MCCERRRAQVLSSLRADESPASGDHIMGGDLVTNTLNLAKASTPEWFRGNERFELIRRLGEGGMGVVYEAFDKELGARVALKTMQKVDGEALLFFKNEFRALQHIHHPHLISLGELLVEGDKVFFTMELVHGEDLLRYVRPGEKAVVRELTNQAAVASAQSDVHPRGRPLFNEARLRNTLSQLSSALMAMHSAGKVHRDIKFSNILVTSEERLVLLDLGLVTGVQGPSIEGRGRALGTAQYMAPEQLLGEAISPASDWYSVGVLLYFALTGQYPFPESIPEMLSRKRACDLVPPSARVDDVPRDLEVLCLDLLKANPDERPTGPAVFERFRGCSAPSSDVAHADESIFVGRHDELTVLQRAYAEARRGRPVTVMIEGESGVGKSALVRHFLDKELHQSDSVVLRGRCYERESVSYKAIDEVMDALGFWLTEYGEQVACALPDDVHLVPNAFPALTNVPSVAAACRRAPQGAPRSRLAVFAAVRALFAKVATRGTLVVWLDDLQWADQDSLALLSSVLQCDRDDQPLPLLLLATIRSDAALCSSVAGLPGTVHRFTVRGLSDEDTRVLASRLMRGQSHSIDLDSVSKEAGGHPLFLNALLRHRNTHRESGAIRLDDALLARIDEMSVGAQEILNVVVVAGGPMPQGLVAEVLGKPFGDLVKPVAELRAAQLVRTSGAHRADIIESFHDRVRESCLARFEPRLLQEWHVRLARAFEAASSDDFEQLAFHWGQAGQNEAALRYAIRAAGVAAKAMAFERAARLYRMAIGHTGDAAQRLELQIALGDTLTHAGRGEEAAAVRLEAAAGANWSVAHELRRGAMGNLFQCGAFDRGISALRELLAEEGFVLNLTPLRSLCSLAVQRTRLTLQGLQHPRTRDAQVDPVTTRRLDMAFSTGMALGFVDTLAAADFQCRALQMALKLGEPHRLALCFGAEAVFVSTAGYKARNRTRLLLSRARDLSSQLKDPYTEAMVASGHGVSALLEGKFRQGFTECSFADSVYEGRGVGAPWEHAVVQLFGLWCQWWLGDVGGFMKRFAALLRLADDRSDASLGVTLRSSYTNVYWLLRGEVAEARRAADDAQKAFFSGVRLRHFHDLLAQGNADLYQGDGHAALARCEESRWALRKSLTLNIQYIRVSFIDLQARSALVALTTAPSRQRKLLAFARRHAAAIEQEGAHWALPLAALRYAGIAACMGDYDEAGGKLVSAIRGFDAADMKLYAHLSRIRLAQLCGDAVPFSQQLRALGIAEPQRILEMFAPGFDSRGLTPQLA
jgi:eukaryotic-like serine/threonine-protein kinase